MSKTDKRPVLEWYVCKLRNDGQVKWIWVARDPETCIQIREVWECDTPEDAKRNGLAWLQAYTNCELQFEE